MGRLGLLDAFYYLTFLAAEAPERFDRAVPRATVSGGRHTRLAPAHAGLFCGCGPTGKAGPPRRWAARWETRKPSVEEARAKALEELVTRAVQVLRQALDSGRDDASRPVLRLLDHAWTLRWPSTKSGPRPQPRSMVSPSPSFNSSGRTAVAIPGAAGGRVAVPSGSTASLGTPNRVGRVPFRASRERRTLLTVDSSLAACDNRI
jgi:hypothetical protein